MDVLLLAKILAALEWQNSEFKTSPINYYIYERFQEILKETSNEFNHLYLEM